MVLNRSRCCTSGKAYCKNDVLPFKCGGDDKEDDGKEEEEEEEKNDNGYWPRA